MTKMESALGKVFDGDGGFADADDFREPRAAGFVTHIRTVRQIVRAELAREESIQERGFVAGSARRVERRFVGGVERLQLLRDQIESFIPGNRLVDIGSALSDHGMRMRPKIFQPDIGFFKHLGDRMAGEDLRRKPRRGGFRSNGLGAVLAELSGFSLAVRIGPCAAGAIESVLLIHSSAAFEGCSRRPFP